MTHASLARRFADDGFVFPISAVAAEDIALLLDCFEPVAADSKFNAEVAAIQGRASRMRQAAMRAASRTT